MFTSLKLKTRGNWNVKKHWNLQNTEPLMNLSTTSFNYSSCYSAWLHILNLKSVFHHTNWLIHHFFSFCLSTVLLHEGLGLYFPLIWNQRPQNSRWMRARKKVIESGIRAHGKYVGPLFPPQWNPKIFASMFFCWIWGCKSRQNLCEHKKKTIPSKQGFWMGTVC